MEINKKWTIKGGNGDFVLVERREGTNPKTGEPTTTEHKTYHPSLRYCAAKIAKSEAIEAVDLDSIEDVKSHLSSLESKIADLVSRENDTP